YGLAIADARLYASTDRGMIYCFAGREVGNRSGGKSKEEGAVALEIRQAGSLPHAAPYAENARYAEAAAEIVKHSAITEGYCVDLACGDGALAYELARRTKLQIYAVDGDEKNVAAARTKLSAAGLYGVRVTVHRASPEK